MRYFRLFAVWIIVFTLVLFETPPTCAAHPAIGVLTIASHAHLDQAMAFPGLSVFEGERLSTEAEGRLGVRVGRSALVLGESTEVELISANEALHIDMTCGSLRFSAAEHEPLEVHAGDVLVRPVGLQATQGAVTLLGPKVLQIAAEKGSLYFRYREEFRQLPEGQTYRIYLDSPDGPEDATIAIAPRRGIGTKVTYFIVGAGAAGGAVWGIGDAVRSGSEPISPAKP
jgi:hypothetical protein